MELINKNRSFSSCIREGYHLFRGNMRNIFISTLKQLTAASLIFAVLVCVGIYADNDIASGLLFFLFLEALVFFKARIFDMIDYRPYGWNIRRMERVLVIAICTAMPFVAVLIAHNYSPLSQPITALCTIAALLVLAILALPMLHVGFNIMMTERPNAIRAYSKGLRRWGFIFLTMLLSTMICCVIFGIVCTPLAIAIYSTISNQAGMAAGDPSGLPSYFPVLLFVTSFITLYTTLFIQTWQTFAMAFAYGSISYKPENE